MCTAWLATNIHGEALLIAYAGDAGMVSRSPSWLFVSRPAVTRRRLSPLPVNTCNEPSQQPIPQQKFLARRALELQGTAKEYGGDSLKLRVANSSFNVILPVL